MCEISKEYIFIFNVHETLKNPKQFKEYLKRTRLEVYTSQFQKAVIRKPTSIKTSVVLA